MSIIIGLPILWASIWIGILWKYLFSFIYNLLYEQNIKWTVLKKLLYFLMSIILIFSIWFYWTTISLEAFMRVLREWFYLSWYILWNGFLIWLSGLWVWIWLWLMVSWLFLYLQKLFSKEWINIGKKVLYIILNILFYIFLYILISFSLTYSYMITFKFSNNLSLDSSQYITLWLFIWLIWLLVAIIQWYIFINHHKNNKTKLNTILLFITLHILLLSSLTYPFYILS